MIEENEFILRDVSKVLRANLSTINVINLRVSNVEDELATSLKSIKNSNVIITNKEHVTLADLVAGVKEQILNIESVLIINATNEAGFSQIEFCIINGKHLEKHSAVDLVLASNADTYNSDGYFGDDVL